MLNFFEWNGIASNDFDTDVTKLIVRKSPNITRPSRKYQKYSVDGRNGDIYIPQEAYNNFTAVYDLFLYTAEKGPMLNELSGKIAEWLYSPRGYARLVDDHESELFRLAYFTGPFDVENNLTIFGKAKAEFNCRPERFLICGDEFIPAEDMDEGWFTLNNKTSNTAKPLITIPLSDAPKLKIQIRHGNEAKQWIYTKQDGAASLTVDSDKMQWASGVQYAGKNIVGDLEMPLLLPGENQVRIVNANANNSEVETNKYPAWLIKPRWWVL